MNASEIERWRKEVLEPVLRGESVAGGPDLPGGGLALLSADTDKIKRFVFESDKLPEIRGGSAILTSLSEGKPPEACLRGCLTDAELPATFIDSDSPGCVVYAGGGSLLALVPAGLADGLCRAIESLYPEETGVATITAVFEPLSADEAQRSFGASVQRLQYRLRRAKESHPAAPVFEAAPHARRCGSCGMRPAAERDPRLFENRWLCSACLRKLKAGWGSGKTRYVSGFEQATGKADWVKYWGDFTSEEAQAANDLQEIAQAEHEHRFVGFIYADGNGIGERLFEATKVEEFRDRSHYLTGAVRAAVFRALAEHTHVRRVERVENQQPEKVIIHPWEIVALGGDDALLIVPGDVALQIAEAICRHFANALREWGWSDATMSAGVVVAHASNPVRFMRELAEELLGSAKRRARELKRGGRSDGAMDFVVLKSQSMLAADLGTLRERAYQKRVGGVETIHLTRRPLTLSEAGMLLTHARLLRTTNFPRSQMQAVRAELREVERTGRPWPALFYHRQKMRLPKGAQAVLNVIARFWLASHSGSPVEFYPWLTIGPDARGRARFTSVWEDLHEIRELLPDEADEPKETRDATARMLQEAEAEEERLQKGDAHGAVETGD